MPKIVLSSCGCSDGSTQASWPWIFGSRVSEGFSPRVDLTRNSFEQQKRLTVKYKDIVAGDYIADFVIDGKIIVEIKAVSRLTSRHQAQALNYLAATGYQLSILLNFGATSLQQRRIVR